jgi:predicted ribosomally synthesized peptide with SipW-like signal peptide
MTSVAAPSDLSMVHRHRHGLAAVGAAMLLLVSVGVAWAYFSSRVQVSQGFVAVFPGAPITATVRIKPETIDLRSRDDVTVFIDSLPAPFRLDQVDLRSVELCYRGRCIASRGTAKLADKTTVVARFTRASVARLVGSARGQVVFVVQGKLTSGIAFAGRHANVVTGSASGTGTTAVGTAPTATAPPATVASMSPTPSPGLSEPPSPSASPLPSDTPDATATPSAAPSAAATPSSAPSPSPDESLTPTPTPEASPSPGATPAPTPSEAPTAAPTPAASATAGP